MRNTNLKTVIVMIAVIVLVAFIWSAAIYVMSNAAFIMFKAEVEYQHAINDKYGTMD